MARTLVPLGKLAEFIEKRIQNKFDLIIFVEGKRGMGKSTFLFQLAKKLNSRGVVTFNPRTHLVYSREKSIEVLARSKMKFIINDEMINVAYNRDFYEQDQKTLLKALNNYRDSCNVFGGCIPKFSDLDTQMKRLCEMRVMIRKRGLAEIHGQVKGFYVEDPWNTKENIKKELKMKGKTRGALKTQRFYVKFKDLTPKEREFYEQLKHDRRNKVFMGEEEEIEDPMKNLYKKMFDSLIKGDLSKENFEGTCRLLGRSIKSARTMLNAMLKDDGREERLEQLFKLYEQKKVKERKDKKKIQIVPQETGGPGIEETTKSDCDNILYKSEDLDNEWDSYA